MDGVSIRYEQAAHAANVYKDQQDAVAVRRQETLAYFASIGQAVPPQIVAALELSKAQAAAGVNVPPPAVTLDPALTERELRRAFKARYAAIQSGDPARIELETRAFNVAAGNHDRAIASLGSVQTVVQVPSIPVILAEETVKSDKLKATPAGKVEGMRYEMIAVRGNIYSILGIPEKEGKIVDEFGNIKTPMTVESLTRIRDLAMKGRDSAIARGDLERRASFDELFNAASGLLDSPDDPQINEWIALVERVTTDPTNTIYGPRLNKMVYMTLNPLSGPGGNVLETNPNTAQWLSVPLDPSQFSTLASMYNGIQSALDTVGSTIQSSIDATGFILSEAEKELKDPNTSIARKAALALETNLLSPLKMGLQLADMLRPSTPEAVLVEIVLAFTGGKVVQVGAQSLKAIKLIPIHELKAISKFMASAGGAAFKQVLEEVIAKYPAAASILGKSGATQGEIVLASHALLRAMASKIMTLLPETEGKMLGILGREAQRFTLYAKKQLVSAIDIVKLEKQIGHVIAEHVGKSYEYLKGRNIALASTFKDIATARDVIYSTLEKNIPAILAFAKSTPGKVEQLALRYTGDSTLGNVLKNGNAFLQEGKKALVILQKDIDGTISLITSYVEL